MKMMIMMMIASEAASWSITHPDLRGQRESIDFRHTGKTLGNVSLCLVVYVQSFVTTAPMKQGIAGR